MVLTSGSTIYVASKNWRQDSGVLAFLMPKELAYQSSYEGWRRLGGNGTAYFQEFHDWSKSGHPFDPVKEDFMTFFIGCNQPGDYTVPVKSYVKASTDRSKARRWLDLTEARSHLNEIPGVAGQVIPGRTAFTFAKNRKELNDFSLIAGECAYIGREGVEFYPQELLLG